MNVCRSVTRRLKEIHNKCSTIPSRPLMGTIITFVQSLQAAELGSFSKFSNSSLTREVFIVGMSVHSQEHIPQAL